jgi:isopentenyl-diphosphate Delta-isomerase
MSEQVILVDENDHQIGLMPKLEAHEKGLLHRAFSVFIFNDNGELLLQKRANTKYHSGGLWTNTCCSHPSSGEEIIDAAKRRLNEEMGIECEVNFVFSFTYHAKLDHDLIEHEFDHVFIGFSNLHPSINKEEVGEWKYMNLTALSEDIKSNPANYTEWMKMCYDRIIVAFEKNRKNENILFA